MTDDKTSKTPPGETEPITDDERRAADALAAALDGREAAMSDDDGAVVEMALMIRASHHEAELGAVRRDALLDAAFSEVDSARAETPASSSSQAQQQQQQQQQQATATVTDLASAREARAAKRVSAMRRAGPLLAMAAALVIVIGALLTMSVSDRWAPARHAAGPTVAKNTPALQRVLSRPSDDLLGRPIARRERAAASARLDRVFADRMAGYRQLRLARSTP
ncbi:MAG: hypothetical protein KC503_23345 [Myxococcales bacterium]|nr:hypothetical protein [Myxococcales bacterium]